VEYDGQGRADPQGQTLGEGSPHGNAVCEVMNGVTTDDEYCQGLEAPPCTLSKTSLSLFFLH